MKNFPYLLLSFFLLISCSSQTNSESFVKNASGRYLFNTNEVLEIYFEEGIMHAKWRGNDNIALLKVNDSSFYMKELNEKMLFVKHPEMHIELAPKTEHDGVKYYFRKMGDNEKTASEYFKDKEYEKALLAFKAIKEKDSLNQNIREYRLNSIGYRFVRNKKYNEAKQMFQINIALYPNSSNVYDSMGEWYLTQKDTLNAIANFKKALSINPENRDSKRFLKRLTNKK